MPKVVPRENLALITNKLTGILTQLEISGLTSKTEALYLMKMAKQDSKKRMRYKGEEARKRF